MIQSNSKWTQFCQQYFLDPNYGFLINPKHQPTSFKLYSVSKQLLQLSTLQNKTLTQCLDNFPDMQIDLKTNDQDMAIVHDISIAFLNKFLSLKGSEQKQTIVIKNRLAHPIYFSSCYHQIKYGMITNIVWNWLPKQPINQQTFGFGDFNLRYYLTKRPDQEIIFFGGSVIAAFHLARAIKAIFEIKLHLQNINEISNEYILDRLIICKQVINKISQENQYVLQNLDNTFFYYSLRPLLQGFSIKFEITPGNIQLLKSSGGTGGHDPSFQIFERGFQLSFTGGLQKTQSTLLLGMTKKHRNLISLWSQPTQTQSIRHFCNSNQKLKKQFNNVIEQYSKFLQLHANFLRKFILQNIVGNNHTQVKGTASTYIHQIISRSDIVRGQIIP